MSGSISAAGRTVASDTELTLFAVAGAGLLLGAALGRWFGGERDEATLCLLGADALREGENRC